MLSDIKIGFELAFGTETRAKITKTLANELHNNLIYLITGKKPTIKPDTTPAPQIPKYLARGKGIPIGYHGKTKIRLPLDDKRHKLLIGPTRSGKTEAAKMLAYHLAINNRGFAFLDNADGEAIDHILNALPDHCLNRTILLDYTNKYYPLPAGIYTNLRDEFDQDDLTNWWVSFFCHNFGIEDQYMTRELITYACKAAFSIPENTLIEVVQMISNAQFRTYTLSKISDPDILHWWAKYDMLSDAQKLNTQASFMRRASVILSNKALRQIVGQRPKQKMDFRKWMDENYIILVKAQESQGSIIVRSIMGLTMLSLWIAALSRDDLPLDRRTPYMIITDEPQTWLGNNEHVIDNIFSKAPKYGLGIICIFQSLQQLDRTLIKKMLDNDPDLLLFQNAIEQFNWKLNPVPQYHYVAQIKGSPPFTCKTLGKLPQPYNRAEFAKTCLEKYGQPYQNVQSDITWRCNQWQNAVNTIAPKSKLLTNGSGTSAYTASPRETSNSCNSSLIIG